MIADILTHVLQLIKTANLAIMALLAAKMLANLVQTAKISVLIYHQTAKSIVILQLPAKVPSQTHLKLISLASLVQPIVQVLSPLILTISTVDATPQATALYL